MPEIDGTILHAVTDDAYAEKLEALRVLCARPDIARVQKVVRVHAPLGIGWLGSPRISRIVDPASPQIVHVWSAAALAWAAPQFGARRRADARDAEARHLLVQADWSGGLKNLARWRTSLRRESSVHFVCPTALAQRRLIEAGVYPDETVLIRESVDFGAINRARGANTRERLDLSPSDTVVLLLAPVTRAAGAFHAAWATLVLEKVRADVRLLVPGCGREVHRLQRLVDSVRQRHVARFDGGRFTLIELLAAADLALYLPAGDAPVSGLIRAMAAGVPIVASAVPVVAELLAHGHNAWLCRPDKPKDAARRMLQALERPEDARRWAETARAQAFKVFGQQRMIEQYRGAYANLLAGRKVGEEIRDSALVS